MGDFLAEAAFAVAMVFFGLGSAVFFGAGLAGAGGAVDGFGFAGFEAVAGYGDLFSLRRKDDALHDALGGVGGDGLGERAVLEVHFAGAEDAVVGVGGAAVDALVVVGLEDEHVVDVEAGAVFGVDEGEGRVDAIGVGLGLDLGEGVADFLVVVAEVLAADGGGAAVLVVGFDVSAKWNHGGLIFFRGLESKGFR
jgi:hypothetical protein